jgi:hypothetical protein
MLELTLFSDSAVARKTAFVPLATGLAEQDSKENVLESDRMSG